MYFRFCLIISFILMISLPSFGYASAPTQDGETALELYDKFEIQLHNKIPFKQIKKTIDQLPDINKINEYDHSPIFYSMMYGRMDVFDYLLQEGADLKKRNSQGYNALHMAAYTDKGEPFISKIVKAGVDIESRNRLEQTPLLTSAAWMISLKTFKTLLAAGADPFATDINGENAAIILAQHSEVPEVMDVLNLLVSKGIDLNYSSNGGRTFLSKAIQSGAHEMIRWAVKNGADINGVSKENKTPLYHGTETKNQIIIDLLIELGATANPANDEMMQPLRNAIRRRLPLEALKKIVNAGADIHYVDDQGMGYLHHLMGGYKTPVEHIEYFISLGLDTNLEDYSEKTPIFNITFEGPVENIKALVKGGADLSIRNGYGEPPLHALMQLNFTVEMARTFFELGVNIEDKDKNGDTILHKAVYNNNFSVTEFLINAGARINAEGEDGNSPFFDAVNHDDGKIIQLLANNGANLEHKNDIGFTPFLHLIQDSVSPRRLSNLLKLPINVNAVDKVGRNAFMMEVAGARNTKLLNQLIDAGINVDHLDNEKRSAWFYLFPQYGGKVSPVILDLLVDKLKSRINNKDNKGRFPLYNAADATQVKVVEKLLANGADVAATEKSGLQAIHVAAQFRKSIEIMKLLIDAGSDVNAKANDGSTPLHYAVSYGTPNMNLVKYLVEQGADINAKDRYEQTPLTVASKRDNQKEAMEYLISIGAK